MTEPALRNLLRNAGATLELLPPYHPQLNTCEYVFNSMKAFLKRNQVYAANHLELAIASSLESVDDEDEVHAHFQTLVISCKLKDCLRACHCNSFKSP